MQSGAVSTRIMSDTLWQYEDLNEVSVRELVGSTVPVVVRPTTARVKSGDDWTMVSFSFVDGEGEWQSFSAFEGSVKPAVWEELVRLVEDWDKRDFRAVFVEECVIRRKGEYLNVNPSRSSDVVVGRIGDALRERGLAE